MIHEPQSPKVLTKKQLSVSLDAQVGDNRGSVLCALGDLEIKVVGFGTLSDFFALSDLKIQIIGLFALLDSSLGTVCDLQVEIISLFTLGDLEILSLSTLGDLEIEVIGLVTLNNLIALRDLQI